MPFLQGAGLVAVGIGGCGFESERPLEKLTGQRLAVDLLAGAGEEGWLAIFEQFSQECLRPTGVGPATFREMFVFVGEWPTIVNQNMRRGTLARA